MNNYNPNSQDAMFATILKEIEHVKTQNDNILIGMKGLDERITPLERSHWYERGVVAAIAVLVSAAWSKISGGS